jgi:hypothetical protein
MSYFFGFTSIENDFFGYVEFRRTIGIKVTWFFLAFKGTIDHIRLFCFLLLVLNSYSTLKF